MTTISKDKIIKLYQADLYYELHIAKEKLKLFSVKYNLSFEDFEKNLKNREEENFEQWDDYIEWKAYTKNYNYLLNEIEEVKNGNYKIS